MRSSSVSASGPCFGGVMRNLVASLVSHATILDASLIVADPPRTGDV